jgi:predicted glycoside hydrolase/deacetylase ChbG (UPF0249 family)
VGNEEIPFEPLDFSRLAHNIPNDMTHWYTRRMSRLIVNADDLGLTDGVDQAVLALHAAGALSSATAMAEGAATRRDAASWRVAELAVGAHVVLLDGWPTSPSGQIPALLRGGAFRPKLGQFTLDLLRGTVPEDEIEREASAQIASLQSLGLRLTHLDTHKHTHMFPQVLRPLLRAARACGLSAVRNPYEPAWASAATQGTPLVRRIEVRLLATRRARFLSEVHRMGMRTTAGALGVLATGTLDAKTLHSLMGALVRHGGPEECYELVCHPAIHDAELDRQSTRLRAQREVERAALLDVIPGWVGPGLEQHRLVSFAHL